MVRVQWCHVCIACGGVCEISRLDEVLEYVWHMWEFAPTKLEALHHQLLAPCATIGALAPLLKVEYLWWEDNYLGQSYALGICACLSLSLPNQPHGELPLPPPHHPFII
jgi:hypothetical protein